MALRAIRAATTVEQDSAEEILVATSEMISAVLEKNEIEPTDLVSIMFSVTDDLRSIAPAAAVRQLGIVDVPLLCFQEMSVDGALPRCVRAILHLETTKAKSELCHIYLKEAKGLRPDLEIGPN